MNASLLLAHFNRISDAPDAIPSLRRFILDLAVRGKLVPQDPNDEPASALLRRIQAEKARISRTERARTFPRLNEKPFDAPLGWEWVRIREITSDRGQTVPDSDFTYIDVTAINKEIGCITEMKILSANEAPSRARKLVQAGDVLYSCVRPYLLNIAVVESDIVPSPIASTAFAILNGFGLVLSKYLWITLRSPFMVDSVETKMRGQAYPAINDSDFALLPFPLPPLAEQHRIVAKVDELMALCDRLEVAQAERESRRNRLVAASLQRLNQPAADQATFRDHARFHLQHLPRLTTRPEHVQQLRQAILNLAVRGQLVPQDPNDEPTSELVSRVQADKPRRTRPDEPDRQKQPQSKAAGNQILGVPATWVWASLADVSLEFRYGTSIKCSYERRGEAVLRIPNMANGRVNIEDLKFGQLGDQEAADLRLQLGDILIVRSNGSLNLVGRPALVEAHAVGFCYAGYLVRVRTSRAHVDPRYIVLALNTSPVREQIELPIRTTVGLKNLNVAEMSAVIFPVPPLNEQHRIVARVDELMAMCDRLEAQLTATQTESRRLLEAVLHEALDSQQSTVNSRQSTVV